MSAALERTGGFDTSRTGTSESVWASLQLAAWSPYSGSLLVISPHPDDETLGAGGLIHVWAAIRGLPVTVLSVTDGEAASPELAGLADIRHEELRKALQVLAPSGPIEIIRLRLPDGKVDEYGDVLEAAIDAAVTSQTTISSHTTIVAPFQQDGHCDHDAAGRAAATVAKRRSVPLAQYPIWAWHQATPSIFSGRALAQFALTPEAQRAKSLAIAQYTSQLEDRPGGAVVPPHVVHYFRRPHEVFVL